MVNFRSALPILLLVASTLQAAPVTLFDGTLGSPQSQGWSYLSLPSGAIQSNDSTSTNLNTTSSSGISAGFNILPPFSIDLSLGVRFFFDVRVNTETHSSNDRAGFSVILLGSNLQGIELAFWSNEVWAQNQNFTHGEGASFATNGLTHYELYMDTNGYRLNAEDQVLLTGALRTYNGQSSSLLAFVYGIPNFLFMGDDTTSAAANFDISSVSIEQVPEPSSFALFVPAALALFFFARLLR